jgi:hypothetical protein
LTYFIVQAPYDKCFEFFFKDELGYPNFYRMNELLPAQEQYHDLVLLAPDRHKLPVVLENILQKMNAVGVKCLSFGEGLDTAFIFNQEGTLQIQPQFKDALDAKLAEFLQGPRLSPSP